MLAVLRNGRVSLAGGSASLVALSTHESLPILPAREGITMQTCQNPNHDCNSPAMYAVQSVVNDSKLGEIVLEERVACPYCADNAAPSEEGVEIRKQAL